VRGAVQLAANTPTRAPIPARLPLRRAPHPSQRRLKARDLVGLGHEFISRDAGTCKFADLGPDVLNQRQSMSLVGQHFSFCLPGCHGRSRTDSCRSYPRVATHPPCQSTKSLCDSGEVARPEHYPQGERSLVAGEAPCSGRARRGRRGILLWAAFSRSRFRSSASPATTCRARRFANSSERSSPSARCRRRA
jgi:hypothetical protein